MGCGKMDGWKWIIYHVNPYPEMDITIEEHYSLQEQCDKGQAGY